MPLITIGQPKRRQGIVRLKPQRSSRIIEARLRRQIDVEIRSMLAEVQPIANSNLPSTEKYHKLWIALNKWEKRFEQVGSNEGAEVFHQTFDRNKKQLIDQLIDKFKVNIDVLWDDKKFAVIMDNSIATSTALIKSIPQQYFNDISKAIMTEMRKEQQPEGRSLWQQIQHIGGVAKERAIFIARDQTSKANAAITEFQQKEAGIEKYVWITSRDNRVVGKPGGLYPRGTSKHQDHYHRDGKIFQWNKPPSDGHPGQPINCRCIAIGIIDRSKFK